MANITLWKCPLGGREQEYGHSWLPWQSFKAAKTRTSPGPRPLENHSVLRGMTRSLDLKTAKRPGIRIHDHASSGRFRAMRVRRETSGQLFSSILLPVRSKSKLNILHLTRPSASVLKTPSQASLSPPRATSSLRIRTKRVPKPPNISASLACLPVEEDLGKWSINSTPRDFI